MWKNWLLLGMLILTPSIVYAQTPAEVDIAHQHLNEWRQKKLSVWMNDFGQLSFYREANKTLLPPPPNEKRVIFFGDSITIAWNLDKFFPGKAYVNRGIGGQTTSQMLLRLRQDVLDLDPAVVVILAGTNDIAGNTGAVSLSDIEANLATIAELAKLHHIAVIFSSLTPANNYGTSKDMYIERPPEDILKLNEWLKAYCQREGLVYVDYYSALVDEKGMLRPGLSIGDGLHPNGDGYKIMAPLASAAIAQVFRRNR